MSRSKTPPPLQKYSPSEEELDRWRVIQLQHKALFRGKALSPSSEEASPQKGKFVDAYPALETSTGEKSRVPTKLSNKLPPTLANPVDHRYIKRKLEQVKRSSPIPKLELSVKPSLLETLHSGDTLLEEAEFLVARKQVESESDSQGQEYEQTLRKTVQELHESAIKDRTEKWNEERNGLISECAALETRKQQLEEL
jgi:hypothetical protein